MTDPGRVAVGVRAAVHALDAALAEHRRALALAAGRREEQRMAHGRAVKAAARASEQALEQPVERPLRTLRLAETWIEVDGARHPLTPGVRAAFAERELLVQGDGWSGRIVVAPGEALAAAARDAVARIEAAAPVAPERGARRLALVIEAGRAHAAACAAAAAALAAADRDALERHADHGRLDACVAELAARLGPRALGEPPETAAARDRLAQARAHLAAAPEQPYAWVGEWPPELAGAILRDLPEDVLEAAHPALVRLAGAVGGSVPLLALAAGTDGAVVAVTPERLVLADGGGARSQALAGDVPAGIAETQPGRLAATLELAAAVQRLRPA
jgi:hypothetical protein